MESSYVKLLKAIKCGDPRALDLFIQRQIYVATINPDKGILHLLCNLL